MIDVKEIGKLIGEEVANEPAVAFYPGGFKPPHKGHFAAAKQLAAKPYINQVKIIIGHGVRDGITAEQSKAIWDLYLKAEPNPKISIEISPDKSPIKPLFSYFANLDNKGYIAGAKKEIESGYFDTLKDKFADRVMPQIINDEFVDEDGDRMSGTEFRATINELKSRFQSLQQEQKGTTEYTVKLNDYNNTYEYLKSLMPESVINKGLFDDVLKVLKLNFPTPKSLQETKDIIPGGLAKGKTLKDIAKKHDKKGYYHIDNMVSYLKKQLIKGIKVEMEHTTSKKAALEIAMDHLWEDPKYYIKLSKIEEVKPNPKNQPDQVWLEEYKNKNQFNPIIFNGEKLDSKIKELLLKIATYFWESLDISEPFDDITLTGSSANYNYTKSSDIDVHILVDFSKFSDPEIIKKFFDAKKNIFNDKHDLKLGKHQIEVYVQDVNEQHTSSGVYSIMNDKWLKKPEYESINIPDGNIKRKVKPFKEKINDLLQNSYKNPKVALSQIEKIQERIKNFRQSGLDKSGEYSLENLAFKDLRNTGYLNKLKQLSYDLKSKQLSLNEETDNLNILERFMSYACNELQIENPPTFEIKYEFGEEQPSFGAYTPSDHHIFINPSNRNVVDVLRTLAHELVHAKQNELNLLEPNSGDTGSDIENDANAIAGILMREYGKTNPNIYNMGMLQENKKKHSNLNELFEKDLPNVEKISPTRYIVNNKNDIEAEYYFVRIDKDNNIWAIGWNFTKNNKNTSSEAWKQVTATSFKIIDNFIQEKKPNRIEISGNNDAKTNIYKSKSFIEKLENQFNNQYKIDNNDEDKVVMNLIENIHESNIKKRSKITRMYLDMDGVIAGFDDHFKKYNEEGLDFKDYIKEYSSNKAWNVINKGKSKFWSEMNWNPGGKELYDYVSKVANEKEIEVWVLSSPGLDLNGDVTKGKNEWLNKHTNIPQNQRVFKQAKDKHTEAKEGYLLIDDVGKNVADFINAGGYGIKNNPQNSAESIEKLHKFGL